MHNRKQTIWILIKCEHLILEKCIYGQIIDSSCAYVFNINAWHTSCTIA